MNEPTNQPTDNSNDSVAQVTAPEIPETSPDINNQPADSPAMLTSGKKKINKIVYMLVAVLVLIVGGAVAAYSLTRPDTKSGTTQAPKPVSRFGVAVGLIEGTAEYSNDNGTSWKSLTNESNLSEKDQIRTTEGRAVLLVDDGSAVRLSANSKIELTSLVTDSIIVTNLGGEVYNRVVAAEARQYQSKAGDQTYTAKGTAFRTFNTDTKKGVEVYHSTVKAEEKSTDVSEGNAFFTLTDQKEKENTVTAIDLTALKKDEFIKWNSDQDKKSAEFAANLGVLVEFDKPDPAPALAPAPTTKAGITLSAKVTEYTANFSWKVNGINTSKGYKLVKSKTSQTPTYPENGAAFVESGKTSYSLYLGDGKTYYFRICAYRNDSCESYSNVVTVTTPLKEKEKIVSGTVTLDPITGEEANWNFNGTAPYGFKLVISASANPTYPSTYNKFSEGKSAPLPGDLTSGSSYYARVCKYSHDGTCVDYSNEVQFTAP
jgi:FecR protein